jgi:protein-disulfide isomerase
MVLCRNAGFTGSTAMGLLPRESTVRAARCLGSLLLLVMAGCAGSAPSSPDQPSQRDFKVLGREDAPVTIVEFTDMQCPYCGLFARTTFPALRKQYIDKGQVRFISRDMPLPFHPYAIPAAVAARCAGEQGKYWEYRERMVSRQEDLPKAPYDDLARQVGLDLAAFDACRKAGLQEQKVHEDAASARAAGISATPTFVLGRTTAGAGSDTIEGAEPLAVFQQKIDALLQKK